MEGINKGLGNNISKGFSENIIAPFTGSGRQRVRLLRPWEVSKLLKAIPKKYSKVQFEFLFYTGMRYIEAQEIYHRPDLFSDSNIHLTPELIRKPKCKIKDRYVILNPVGKKVAEEYFALKKQLPRHWGSWVENLQRWCVKAGIDPSYMSTKTTRKTWESYLFTCFPEHRGEIYKSIGHTKETALDFYIGLPFSSENKKNMWRYTAGWLTE